MIVRKAILAAALAAATITAVIPATASARDRGRHYGHGYSERHHGSRDRYAERRGYRDEGRYRCRKSGGTTGLLVGGVAGALLGRSIDTRGDRATGTVLGAGAGALAGRAIDRNSRC
jgi:uncharacterized protein YcfJ